MTKTVVAHFEVPFIQLLTHDGDVCQKLLSVAYNRTQLIDLYRSMLLARLFDKKAIALQRTGKIGTYPPINGQEAISSAIGCVMKPEDVLVPYYRDYAAQFYRGVKIADILSYWGGDERGSDCPKDKQDLPMCVPIASQCLHAVGVAFAFTYRHESRVAVVTLGDGATSEGDFYEAINAAGVWKLPVVFVINNNQWAISVNIKDQTSAKTLAQKSIAAGFEGIQVDGNDVLALAFVIDNAIQKARRGEGPTLIEALNYRLCDHTTADDAKRYQPEEEVAAANHKEPIKRFKQFLFQHHQWSEDEDLALIASCLQEIDQGVNEYLSRPLPCISSAFDYVFETLPDYLIEQKAMAVEEALNA